MGAKHEDGSQGRLHELFVGFPSFVRKRIEHELRERADHITDRKIRVIDIGAGEVPYFEAFSHIGQDKFELVCLDSDPSLPAKVKEKSRPFPDHRWLSRDFFDLLAGDGGVLSSAMNELGGKFDLVIMAASLHEFYYDAVVKHECPPDFHQHLLSFVKDHLLHENGVVLVADYAWPEAAFQTPGFAAHVGKIRDIQRKPTVANHGDPPWTFLSIGSIQRAAHRAGLRLTSSNGKGLHDKLSDEDLKLRFRSELSLDEEEILRLRVGFVLTFGRSDLQKNSSESLLNFLPHAATVFLSRETEKVFREPGRTRTSKLDALFTAPQKELGNLSPLAHLAGEVGSIAEESLRSLTIPSPGTFELWINMGLKQSDADHGRYVPKLSLQWDPAPGPQPAGIVVDYPRRRFSGDDSRPLAGRITIPFRKHLLERTGDTVTLHDWFAALNRLMRKQQCNPERDMLKVRSLTVIAHDLGETDSEETAQSLCLASQWRDDNHQRSSGHYLVVLPRLSSLPVGRTPLVDALNAKLREIVDSIQHADSNATQVKSLSPNYETWLRAVFYPDTAEPGSEAAFNRSWEGLTNQVRFPAYRAFSTIALGCDGLGSSGTNDDGGGLATNDPDTVMVFSSQAFPPNAHDRISNELHNVCSRISTLESEILIETEAASRAEFEERERQHRVMVASFGHDGKRPASTIELLLRLKSECAAPLARMLSRSLVLRLEAFSSLLDPKASVEEARKCLKAENQRAEKHTTIQAIWEEEALNVLLRILVDGSGFKAIRDNLFGEGVTVDTFKREFTPLLEFLALDTPFDLAGRAGAVRNTLKRFSELTRGFSVQYDGPEVNLPYVLSGTGGEARVPLALTSVAFLLSEMLTNTAKHQWPSLKAKLKSNGIHLLLRVVDTGADLFDLSLFSNPVLSTSASPDLAGEDRTLTGLTSLLMVATGVGVTPDCKQITVNGKVKGAFPFPENRETCWNGNTAVWSTYNLRGLELVQTK